MATAKKIEATIVDRTYKHREHGDIGSVQLIVEDGKWTINGNELPTASVHYLANFALQSFQDAYAGAKSQDEAIGAFNKKVDAVVNGTVGLRTGGVSDVHKVMRTLARKVLRRDLTKVEFKTFNNLETADQNSTLDTMIKDKEATYKTAADKYIKAEAARAKELAGLTDELTDIE